MKLTRWPQIVGGVFSGRLNEYVNHGWMNCAKSRGYQKWKYQRWRYGNDEKIGESHRQFCAGGIAAAYVRANASICGRRGRDGDGGG